MVDDTSGRSESAASAPAAGSQAIDLRQLVSDHYRAVYRYAYRLCGREADAEDLTQQAFLMAQKRLHQIREPDKADRWLFAIVRRCFLKAVGRSKLILADSLELTVPDQAEANREVQAFDREELQHALNELPEDARVIVLMFYFDELSYKEIAEQLEIPIGTVMSRLARAKARLRGHLFSEPVPGSSGPASRPRVPVW